MLGHEPAELPQHIDAWRERVHPEDLVRAGALLQAHIDGHKPLYECEHRLRNREGDWVWVLARGRVVEHDTDRRAVRVIGTHLDVTERRAAIEALHETDRRKDEFIAMLGHELRNPLAGLTNALRVLADDGSLDDTSRHAAAIAQRQLRQLHRLVDDLLDVSRITHGHVELLVETVTAESALGAAVDGMRSSNDARDHRLVLEPPPPSLAIRADRVRLAQILDNLLHNACKYTPPDGTITVSARPEGAFVALRIADTGIGLDADALARVFEPFTQVAPGVGLAQGGLGIGLSLVRRLAELHGGAAWGESAGPGRGSTFGVRLPMA
jgi:PAS domain S-box-containing protein